MTDEMLATNCPRNVIRFGCCQIEENFDNGEQRKNCNIQFI